MSKWEVKQILKERKRKGSNKKEYLIVWENTWEKASNLKESEALKRFLQKQNKSKPKSVDKRNDGKDSEKSVDEEEDQSMAENDSVAEESDGPKKTNKRSKRGPKGKPSKNVDNSAEENTPQEENGDHKSSGSDNEKVSVDPRNELSDEGTEGEGDITAKEKARKSKRRSVAKRSSRPFKPPVKKSNNN